MYDIINKLRRDTMDKKLIDLFKYGNIVIPLYLFQNISKFKLELKDFIFLMYLYNCGDLVSFDPNKISESLGISVKEVMSAISNLCDKRYIELKVVKNDKNISEEVISLHNFYEKISFMMMDNISSSKKIDTSCFDFIEKEFGRTLSPMEYEIIKAWIDGGNSDEIIMEAVKEATFNGVNNLRYIDKILYEWGKKGLKSKEDVENNRKSFRKIEEENDSSEELFDYNWFEDDELDDE